MVTVTFTDPAATISAEVIVAVNPDELTNVVALAAPLKFTVAPPTNPVPLTVRVNPAPPATAEAGESIAIVGGGAGRIT